MWFARKALGLEISSDGAKMALIGVKRNQPELKAYGVAPFPAGVVRVSPKEVNVQNPATFVATVREMYLKLLTPEKRVSVSLPDASGRVVLLDLETRFKNRDEGADIIRWKLKKTFPYDISEAHLDYQVVEETETGEISLLVSFIAKPVVHQYEELLVEAGLEPNRIDFTTFNLYRLFAQRLELAENSVVITCYGEVTSMLVFYGGALKFYRAKEMPGGLQEPNRLFRELNSSFLVFREKYPDHAPTEAFCISSGDEGEALCAIVAEATGLAPVLLEGERVVAHENTNAIDGKILRTLTASLGAATRNL